MNSKETIKRIVKFEYYQLVLTTKDGKEKLFDLIQWMGLMKKKSIEECSITYNTDQIRVDQLNMNESEEGFGEYAFLHFSRLRDSNIPSITSLSNNNFKDIELESNEFIAEDVSGLFDEENFILMLQRNIHSLSPTAIGEYMSYFWSEEHEGEVIELRPVMLKNTFEKGLKNKHFRKLIIKTADVEPGTSGIFNKISSPFADAFKSLEAYEGVNIEISISASRRKENLNYDEMIDSLEELKKLNDLHLENGRKEDKKIQKLQINAKEDENSKVEKMDLLNGKVTSILEFDIPIKTALSSESVQIDMLNEYDPLGSNKKKELTENLKKKRE